MIRKVWGEDSEGLRSAARAMYNLVHYCNAHDMITSCKDSDPIQDYNKLLEYTSHLAKYPYEVAFELQKLWDSFYWEKKEDAYSHIKKSKFSLEPGDTYTKTNSDGSEEAVIVKDSDMIMTKGDLNKC